MAEISISEFPFVAALPKREKGKLAKLWDLFQEMKEMQDREGCLCPQSLAAKLLGVSKQRIDQLANEERLKRVYVDGHALITENSILALVKTERKTGRPPKCPTTYKETAGLAVEWAKECVSSSKKK